MKKPAKSDWKQLIDFSSVAIGESFDQFFTPKEFEESEEIFPHGSQPNTPQAYVENLRRWANFIEKIAKR